MSEWSDSKSWLFINNDGHLRRIYCPFPVLCIADVKDIPRMAVCTVKAVRNENYSRIYYAIQSDYYLHSYFRLKL